MPAIISLIEILKNYSDYLIATAADMNMLYYSNESARSPENKSTMYRISACEHDKLKDDYIELEDYLFKKPFYEYVDIQQFLPKDIMKQYWVIKKLQFTFSIGIY
ncbi:4362_t:CDS:1, partial [Cetraspora pellucida]